MSLLPDAILEPAMAGLRDESDESIRPRSRPRNGGRWTGAWNRWIRPALFGAVSIAFFIGLWQLASHAKWHLWLHFENVPPPTEVAASAGRLFHAPKFTRHVGFSLFRIFAGFGIAAVSGVGLGLLIGRLRSARESLLPLMEVFRPIPAVAWIPLAILIFATAEQSMIYITFIGAFFPILLNTIHGVESLDRRLVYASLTLGAGPFAVFREVILPGALPSIVTGLSIGMGTSWFSLVTAEMISGQFGMGYYTWESYTLQNYPNIILGMISIGVLGMGSSLLITWAGRACMPWFKPGTAET
jgi:NitT/TauT family transport system permease protein